MITLERLQQVKLTIKTAGRLLDHPYFKNAKN